MRKALTNIGLACAVFLLVIVIITCMTGCSRPVTKSLTKETYSNSADTITDTNTRQVAAIDSFLHDKESQDTTIGVAGGNVSLTLLPCDDDVDTTVRNGNVSLHLYTDDKGQKHADCKADSLTMVVKNLIRENTVLKQSRDTNTTNATTQKSYVDTRSLETVVQEERKGFWGNIKAFLCWFVGYLVAGIIAIIVWEILKKAKQISNAGGI